jgi:hypothetical protein
LSLSLKASFLIYGVLFSIEAFSYSRSWLCPVNKQLKTRHQNAGNIQNLDKYLSGFKRLAILVLTIKKPEPSTLFMSGLTKAFITFFAYMQRI